MVKEADGLESYPWSSLKHYLGVRARRPACMETQAGFSVAGTKDSSAGRWEFLEILERRVDWKNPTKAGTAWSEAEGLPKLAVHSSLRRGWFFGSQAFKGTLLGAADGKFRERAGRKADGYHGSNVRDHGEKGARALI